MAAGAGYFCSATGRTHFVTGRTDVVSERTNDVTERTNDVTEGKCCERKNETVGTNNMIEEE